MCISTICNTCACRMASKRFQQFYILYSDRRFFRFKQRDTGDYATTNSVFFFLSRIYQLKEFNSTDHDRSFRQQQLGRTALPSRRVNYYEFRPGSWVSGAFVFYYAYPVRRARDLDHLILLPLVPVDGRGGKRKSNEKVEKRLFCWAISSSLVYAVVVVIMCRDVMILPESRRVILIAFRHSVVMKCRYLDIYYVAKAQTCECAILDY